jgi:cytochrome c-type biogenesis protein CcmH
MRRILLTLCLFWATSAYAVIETYQFDSAEMRERYHVFVKELRCPKCQNQNLEDSNAGVAADLRREVHRLLHEGYSDDEIYDYMVARYGEFVLYRPRTSGVTLYLWLAPAVLLALAIAVVALIVKRSRKQIDDTVVASDDQERLNQVLSGVQQESDKS